MDVTAASANAPVSSSGTQFAAGDNKMFLTLLMTELQNQDPLSPMDATTMVGQLTQFQMLNELMNIRQFVQQLAGTQSTAKPVQA
jgi:flagellar basal-body rod modification protein FlgD